MAKTITFQVTDACNLKCTYCYQTHKNNHSMPFDTAKHFIDKILSTDDHEYYVNPETSMGCVIEFIGGEPLLEIDLIDKITDYFISQLILKDHPWATRFRISICSNGILYFDEKVQRYLKKHRDHLSFSITIDGNKELHDSCRITVDGEGSYDIAMAAVNDWRSLGNHMGSKITIAPQNVIYTFNAVKSMVENDYDQININCVFEEGWTYDHATILYYELKKLADYMINNSLLDTHDVSIFDENLFKPQDSTELQNWCGGNGSMIAIDYKGDIYPCIRYMESSLGGRQRPLKVGNVFDGILKDPLDIKMFNELEAIDRRSQSTDECFNCPIGAGCAWCTAYNYEVFGTPNKRATFICPMHKARALANIYLWNKWYIKTGDKKVFKNYVPDNWALQIIPQEELNMLKKLEER